MFFFVLDIDQMESNDIDQIDFAKDSSGFWRYCSINNLLGYFIYSWNKCWGTNTSTPQSRPQEPKQTDESDVVHKS